MSAGLKQFFSGIAFLAALGMFYAVGYFHGATSQVFGKVATFVDVVQNGVTQFTEFRQDVKDTKASIKKTKDEFIAEIRSLFRFKIGKNGEYILVPPDDSDLPTDSNADTNSDR